MALRIDPTTPADLDAIARLLCSAFGAPSDAPFVDRDLLRWKYLEPAGGGVPARSYVVRQGAAVVAHCAIAPLTLCVGHDDPSHSSTAIRTISGACFMDWVGDRRVPGAGVLLLRKMMALSDVSVIAAGSDATRALGPKIGFKQRQTLDLLARVIRPLRQARSRPRTGGWRDAARLLRNTLWSLPPPGRVDPDWRAAPVTRFESLPAADSHGALAPERSAADLNYWMRCPAVPISGFEIHRRGICIGYFLLSRVGGQTRLVDLRLRASSASDWEVAYRLALRAATVDRESCEVVSLASTPQAVAALEACGFRRRGAVPLFVHDARSALPQAPLVWSMIDDDTAYLSDALNPYAT